MRIRALHTIILIPALTMAQPGTGTLAGRIVDDETKQPLVAANVFLRGTFLGGTSDAMGNFRIQSIPVGVYTMNVTLVGYHSVSFEGIDISDGLEKRVDVALKPAPIQADQVVITASKHEQSIKEVPASISTVTAQAIADRITLTLDDALRYVPGVNMMQDQVNIRGSTGYSRGVGSRVLVLFDGLPYTTGDTGEITWETLPMYQVDRIEIVKGAGSALYGSNALGGVVNVITKEVPGSAEGRWRLYSGMYDEPRYSEWVWSDKPRFHSGGHLSYSDYNGPMSFTVSLARSVDESYKENDAYHRWNVFTKLKYQLSTTRNMTLTGNFMSRSHGNFFWWKSLSEATRPAPSQRGGNVDSKRGNVSFLYKEFITQDFFYTVKGIYYGNFWRDDSAGRVNNVSASHVFYLEGQATYQTSPGNILTFGGGANYDQVNSDLFGNHPGAGAALYLQDELKIGEEWKLTLGMRFDLQKVSAFEGAAQLSPKLGLVYTPEDKTTLRASAGAGFRYPSISELYTSVSTGVTSLSVVPNPDLRSERSVSFEVGGSHTIGENIFVDAAFFQNDFGQLIEAGVDAGPPPVVKFDNVTKARVRGVEAGTRSSWFDNLISIDASYTYVDPRDLTRNTVLKFRPRHLAYASLGVTFDNVRALVDGRYVSRVESIDENLVRLAPIVNGDRRVPIKIVDVRLKYDLLDAGLPVRAGFSLNNVFNYHYVELIGNLAPVRTYVLMFEGVF